MNELNAEMAALRNKVGEIADLIPRGKPVVFLDYPVYLNVGDLLIAKGTETFFRAFGYRVMTTRSALDFDAAQTAAIPPDATIVFQGGGNFGDLYELHQQFRERVIARCRTNRIVILPQTIHFESAARLDECAAVFARHPDLHVCVRDHASHDLFRRHFPNPTYLFPDMAHFLWDELAPRRQGTGSRSTLLFMRVDKEGSPFVHESTAGQTPIDWRDIMSLTDRVAFALLLRLHQRHDDLLPGHEIYPFWRLFSERMIRKAIRTLVPHGAVVTNRLHMALLGLLMGRRVEMADNSYGKLSAYYGCWLETIPTVELLSSRAPAAPQRAWASAAV
jgi:pyruvyl transferase EpsO